jgi:hypothetical protein
VSGDFRPSDMMHQTVINVWMSDEHVTLKFAGGMMVLIEANGKGGLSIMEVDYPPLRRKQ